MVFCTLFDSNYLDKGLALYRSMERNITKYKLYIFAFDNVCFDILSKMHLKNVILVLVNDIMNDLVKKIRKERTRAEFCWTCTPLVIEYVLRNYKEKMCTYVDADIYFFSNPRNAIQEVIYSRKSVGLVAHRFEKNAEYGKLVYKVGKYCIQFNTFLNNKEGLQVLEEWKQDCLNWCYCRYEDGRYGDQKYPDKWKMKYFCVHEIQDPGVGVAPWNLHLYSLVERKGEKIWVEYKGRKAPLCFYHFEGIEYLEHAYVFLNVWNTRVSGTHRKIKLLYGEYFKEIGYIRKFLAQSFGVQFNHLLVKKGEYFQKKYSLKKCIKCGWYEGIEEWLEYRKHNIVKVTKFFGKNR